ncbi:hypothetical protein Patl1_02259 [Pistacia atlantica]|uniref:Uncharacterized protein n=1 Tax=Pistacia atlantica TaxID=434234 RepID=A0ACC1C5L9_9ROSI|nr:hypothetical protein Patl1_02259 [Pistacia atlantica]
MTLKESTCIFIFPKTKIEINFMAKSSVRRQMSDEVARFLEGTASFADIVFRASEENNDSLENFCENDEDSEENVEENKAFWETQDQLLQATICRTSSIESKVRQATKGALSEINLVGLECVCRKPVAGGCRNCLQRELSLRLQNAGYNCAICKSKWKSSQEIPPGQHIYLEVVEKLSSKKGEMRVVIELNFRGEFEMAKSNGQEVYEGEENAYGSMEKAKVHAGKVAGNIRKNNTSNTACRILRQATKAKSFNVNL